MADKNQQKIADQVDLADDDPFAELTRIMGFDPRQPAKRAAEKQAPAPAEQYQVEQAAEEDDFSLDLEKELLGGFDIEDETPDYAVEAAAPVEAQDHEFRAHESRDAEPEAPEADFDFSADFDAAMAASAETELETGQDDDLDLGLTEDDVRALDDEALQPAVQEEPAIQEETEAEFDLGLTEDDVRVLYGEEPESAGAAETEDAQLAAPEDAEADFDLGLTVDDVRALDAEILEPMAPVETASAVDVSDGDADIEADLDAAMADIDMDFVGDASASELAAPAGETAQAEPAAGDVDLHLFDEDDFRLEDDSAPVAEQESAPQPEIDEAAFSFGEDDLRFDDEQPAEELVVAAPAEEPAAEPPADESPAAERPADEPLADELSFDDVDFAAEDFSASVEPEAAVAEPPTEPDLAYEAEPDALPHLDLSAQRQEPRKLPVSPMDVAAEEFRQREATPKPAEPEFNLEDELNALLGNIRASQAAAEAATSAAPFTPPVEEPSATSDTPATHSPSAYEPPVFRPAEPVSFDAPEHPADIDDDLNWELDAFTAEAEPEQAEEEQAEAFAEDDQAETYAQDEQYYAETEQPEADGFDAAEEPAPMDFSDETDDQQAEEDAQPAPSTHYGDALAGAAIGAATSRFGSGFAGRPFEAASARLSDLPRTPADAWPSFTARPQAAAQDESFSSHRDPVVRGNPLKEDPLDVITALAEKYSKKEPVTPYGRAMGVVTGSAPEDEDIDISAAFEEQPEVETVEVADRAVALADDLDIPELAEDEDLPPVSAYDDLDAEFSSLLSDMNAEPRAAQPAGGQSFDERPFESQAAQPARKIYDDDPEPDSFALDADELPGSRMPAGGQYAADEYDYDPQMDQEIAPQHLAAERGRQPKSRGMLLAALVGGVALLGGIGAFALSFGDGGGSDAPALVKADEGPLKVKPENPGGATVPNQDNKVYETVAGEGGADAPQQEKLVTTAEEPVDVTPPPPAMEEETAAAPPFGKGEDRIEQILQEAENQTDGEIAAVAPRKVRTMVVKPDGTLVPREDEPAAPSAGDTVAAAVPETAPAPVIPETPAVPEATGALPAAPAPVPGLAPAPEEAAPAPEQTPPQEETAAAPPPPEQAAPQPEATAAAPGSEDRGAMPETAPIAPLRPADQPIDVVGEVKPDQVAAATATAAPAGNWAMQIASQPSEAAAQSSYQDLARRYGGVLEGKEVNIVKAEIAGKGTFWRVRVPADSRNEAISLCENYKAAGGNCFVSR
jgi:hypothetical protein